MNKNEKIDFVITWLDSENKEWQKQMLSYIPNNKQKTMFDPSRFRDWNNLNYWFRSVEKNAPWVNKIHLVTNSPLPLWLNKNHPKLNIVKHEEFIPKKYLPTFNCHPIELNFFRINSLSEYFVYFCDDMFVNLPVKKEDFFKNQLPCYQYGEININNNPNRSDWYQIIQNDMDIINKEFNKNLLKKHNLFKMINAKYPIKRNLMNLYYLKKNKFSWFYHYHNALPIRKSTMQEVWDKEFKKLDKTCFNKFRSCSDINEYIFTYWELARGSFFPYRYSEIKYSIDNNNLNLCINEILNPKKKLLCLNDTENCDNFLKCKYEINKAFQKRYPKKSSFEL